MNIAFTKKMEKWIRDQVKAGHYNNASEVVRDILRDHMVKQAETAHLKKLIDEGIADVKAGRVINVPVSDKVGRKQFFNDLFEEAKREIRTASGKKPARRRGAA